MPEYIKISKEDFLEAYMEVGNGIADEHFEEFWTILKLISDSRTIFKLINDGW